MKFGSRLIAGALLLAGLTVSGHALAGAAPEEAMAMLQKRGYTDITIKPDDSPGYEALACKGGTRFAVTMDPKSNIIDVDPQGKCGGGERYAAAPPAPPVGPVQPAPHIPQGDGGYKGEGLSPPPYEPHGPEYAYAPILDRLYRKGYYNIRIVDIDDDEIEVLACKRGRFYEIELKIPSGRIDDRDRKGRCGPRSAARYDTHVDAPYASVRTGPGNVDVRAPFTGVHVGRGEVHIRAPFVDLRIPK